MIWLDGSYSERLFDRLVGSSRPPVVVNLDIQKNGSPDRNGLTDELHCFLHPTVQRSNVKPADPDKSLT